MTMVHDLILDTRTHESVTVSVGSIICPFDFVERILSIERELTK